MFTREVKWSQQNQQNITHQKSNYTGSSVTKVIWFSRSHTNRATIKSSQAVHRYPIQNSPEWKQSIYVWRKVQRTACGNFRIQRRIRRKNYNEEKDAIVTVFSLYISIIRKKANSNRLSQTTALRTKLNASSSAMEPRRVLSARAVCRCMREKRR